MKKIHLKKRYRLKRRVKKILILLIMVLSFISIKKIKKTKYYKNIKKEVVATPIFKTISNNDELFIVKNIDNNNPIVYLYNTHQGEKYLKDENEIGVYTPSIITATSYLNEKLNDYDIKTIMEQRSVEKIVKENNWSYGKTYKVSRNFLEDTFNNNSTLKYFFDIHRDAGSHDKITLCKENKCYAKILFVIGKENPNYLVNESFARTLNDNLNTELEGLSRGVLLKEGPNVNGVYNQDFNKNVLLIEIGSENSYINEVYNTIDILSLVLSKYIKGDA